VPYRPHGVKLLSWVSVRQDSYRLATRVLVPVQTCHLARSIADQFAQLPWADHVRVAAPTRYPVQHLVESTWSHGEREPLRGLVVCCRLMRDHAIQRPGHPPQSPAQEGYLNGLAESSCVSPDGGVARCASPGFDRAATAARCRSCGGGAECYPRARPPMSRSMALSDRVHVAWSWSRMPSSAPIQTRHPVLPCAAGMAFHAMQVATGRLLCWAVLPRSLSV
jgi:hypothetical protein